MYYYGAFVRKWVMNTYILTSYSKTCGPRLSSTRGGQRATDPQSSSLEMPLSEIGFSCGETDEIGFLDFDDRREFFFDSVSFAFFRLRAFGFDVGAGAAAGSGSGTDCDAFSES